jgi:DNA polymerase III delta prime subunit
MNKTLTYKYKPKTIHKFEIGDDIKHILTTLLKMNNLNILILGDSGTGKSALLDAIVNEYYEDNFQQQNVLYINNLKEQGIQYYRNEVKTFSQTYSNIINKKKCIILDDIDNINEQSQQVFRNCIDKYSNNVNFICSCTNIQKVIDSIQSRMIIIKLKPVNNNNLTNILNSIVINENINIDIDARDFLINLSNNSIRIMINYLEKFKILNKRITINIAKQLCSNISFLEFEKYTTNLIENKLKEGIRIFYNLYHNGYSVIDILDNYFIYVKLYDFKNDNIKYEIIKLLCKYITIFHNLHEDEIELALFSNNLHDIILQK